MKKVFAEFKEFALKGSVIDLAVGIIIGAAFNSIVQSLVKDIIMPPVGFLLGKVDFSELYINLGSQEFESLKMAQEAGAPTINYGLFINSLISFLITAWVVFLIVKFINRIRRERDAEAPPTPTTRACPYCTKEIQKKATRCPFCTAELKGEVS